MNKNRALILTLAMAFILACTVSSPPQATATQPPVVEQATYTPLPTNTPQPTFTTAAPIDTLEPTIVIVPSITPPALPQTWDGFYNQTGYGRVGIQLLIESMTDNAFKGKMLWLPSKWYNLIINRMNGEYVQDFGDSFEQGRWSKHPDFQDGISNGIWLKWTETETISGNTLFTMNGWYYAHIRNDGTMAGIYYFNAKETIPASDYWEVRLKK